MHQLVRSVMIMLAAAVVAPAVSMAQGYSSITPEPGEVTELSEIILTFDGTWEQVDRSKKFTFTGPDGVDVPKLRSGSLGAEVGFYFSFADEAVITAPGDYTLTIPEGRFGCDGVLCPEVSYTWTVVASGHADDTAYTITPAPGEVPSLSEMTLTFSGDWAQGDRSKKFLFTGPDGIDVPALKGSANGSGYTFYFADDAVIATPGEYSLYIPEGRFTIDGADAPEATFIWTVTGDPEQPADPFSNYTILPPPGEYETLNDGLILWFDSYEAVSVNNSAVFLQGPSGDIGVTAEVSEQTNAITVIPLDAEGCATDLTEKGEYTLIFGLGALRLGDSSNTEPLVFKYYLTGSVSPWGWMGEYTTKPADESAVSALKDITITFDARSVTVSEYADPTDFPYLLNNETLDVVTGATVYAEGNKLNVSLNTEVTDPGYYILVVPAALINVDGMSVSDDLYVCYTVVGETGTFEYNFSLYPASGEIIGAEGSFSITFSGDDLASVSNDSYAWGKNLPHFTNTMDAFNPNLVISADGMTFTLSHQWPFEVDGEYTLVIPTGYFTLTSNAGEETKSSLIEAIYTVKTSSIQDIDGGSIPSATFTLDGIKVGGARMPAGVYIVNGKKTYLK